MKILKTPFKDLLIIKSKQYYDDRGYFRELEDEAIAEKTFEDLILFLFLTL